MAGPQTGAPGGHGHGHVHGPVDAPHEHGEHEGHAHDEHGFLETVQAIGTEQRRQRRRVVVLAALFVLAGATAIGECSARLAAPEGASTPADCAAPPGGLVPVRDAIVRYAVAADARLVGAGQPGTGPATSTLEPGRRRVLMLGGADVLGLPGDPLEGPCRALAERLGPAWTGLALGAPGWTAAQAVRAFALAQAALAPDLVVLDLDDEMVDTQGAFVDSRGRASRDFLPLPEPLKRFLWRHSALYAHLARSYTNEVLDVPDPATDARPPNAFARPGNQDAALAAVARLGELCRAHGTPLLVVFRTALPCGPGAPGAQRTRAFGARLAEQGVASTTDCAVLPDPVFLSGALERAGLLP